MRILLLFLAVFLFFVWLGLKIQADPGYVLLAYQHLTVEMPLWAGITAIILGFVLFYIILRLLNQLGSITTRWRLWARQRRLRRAHERTSRGLLELAEGRFASAEKDLLRAAQYTDMPLINYLAAARAAQAQGQYERRDDYLHKAHLVTPSAEIAVGLTQAQLQYGHQQLEQALATLRRLHDLAPKNVCVLQLLQKIYLDLRDYESLEALLPQLRKYKVILAADATALEQTIFIGLLTKAEKENSIETVNAVWERIPKDLKFNPEILVKYIQFLLKNNDNQKALELLADSLKRTWDTRLIKYYGDVVSSDPTRQLNLAEYWLKSHPDNSALLLTLAKLCMHNQLWGKARGYLDACLSIAPTPDAYWWSGQLWEKMGDKEKAEQCYRQGLLLSL